MHMKQIVLTYFAKLPADTKGRTTSECILDRVVISGAASEQERGKSQAYWRKRNKISEKATRQGPQRRFNIGMR
jgi:hypothetical protein